jgi:hypothetical protein
MCSLVTSARLFMINLILFIYLFHINNNNIHKVVNNEMGSYILCGKGNQRPSADMIPNFNRRYFVTSVRF